MYRIFCSLLVLLIGGLVFADDATIPVGESPRDAVWYDNKLFVLNGGGTVSVISTKNLAVLTTIPVGKNPTSLALSNKKIYVSNYDDETLSVIDAIKQTVIGTIPVGIHPNYLEIGTNAVYVTNIGSNTVSVIDTVNNVFRTNPSLGDGALEPSSVIVAGGRVYVLNVGNSSVSIIDQKTNSLKKMLSVSGPPTGGTAVKQQIYIYHAGGSSISVIKGPKDTFSDNIIVSNGVVSGTVVGTNLYVNNMMSNSVSVIDTLDNTITKTIKVGAGPISSTLVGTNLYVNNSVGNSVSIIDTLTNKVTKTIKVGAGPISSTLVGTNLYVINSKGNSISVINTTIMALFGSDKVVDNTPGICLFKSPHFFRKCPLKIAPTGMEDFEKNMVCEGILQETGAKKENDTMSRYEAVEIAVGMLRTNLLPYTDYAGTYSDIKTTANNHDQIAIIQTGIANNILSQNAHLDANQNVTRIEAYTLLMRSVCLAPETTQIAAWMRVVHQVAYENGITVKPWAQFGWNRIITKKELYTVAFRLADWADQTGGCQRFMCQLKN